jgi:hypothetical protein
LSLQPAARRRRRLATALTFATAAALSVAPAALGNAYRGVNLHSLWNGAPSADIRADLDHSRELGVNVVRLDIGWASLETNGKGDMSDWYVEKLDEFMAGADARGIKVILTLMNSPCWASSAPETLKQGCTGSWWSRDVAKYAPTNPQDYADAARFITARYGSRMAALEIWNEPNPSQDFFRSPDPARDYVNLVKAAYPAAKAGNPDVPVLAGSLATADVPFLKELYAHGMKGHYDGLAIHPYNEWRDPADMWEERWKQYTLIPGTRWIRETQLANGDETPLWLTEFGWATCTDGGRMCVSRQQQAEYTAKSVALLRELPYVAAFTTYALRDEGTSGSRNESYGLVEEDYRRKPSFAAFAQALGGTAPAPPPTAAPPATDPATGAPAGSTPKPAVARRVRIRLERRGVYIYATGTAPEGSRLAISARKCRRKCRRVRLRGGRRIVVRASADGRFEQRVGKIRRLARARVRARVMGRRAARGERRVASARVR